MHIPIHISKQYRKTRTTCDHKRQRCTPHRLKQIHHLMRNTIHTKKQQPHKTLKQKRQRPQHIRPQMMVRKLQTRNYQQKHQKKQQRTRQHIRFVRTIHQQRHTHKQQMIQHKSNNIHITLPYINHHLYTQTICIQANTKPVYGFIRSMMP